ncbi:MAG: anti-sigma factor, partial [Acidobacteriales bacterium]|nr:anti-sigma factor [Terriglobales bacterium]
TPPSPTGRVVYLPSRGGLILQASNLAPIPTGKTYELWVIPADGSAPIPAGLFKPDVAGNGLLVLPSIPQGVKAKAFGVTLEDAAGSKTPTAPILMAGAAPQSGE